jgi:transposase
MLSVGGGREIEMDVELRDTADLRTLEQRIRCEKNAKQRDRYRAVWLALRGLTAPQITYKLDRSRRFVQAWVYRYRDGGLDNLTERPRPGRPTELKRELEAAVRARIEAGPKDSDGVCTLRGKDIQRILEQEFGAMYTLDGAYDLLHRLGYSCLRPRPRHRKNDPQVMAQWKRDAPLLSKRSAKRARTSKSKSGSRTKAGSDNRAR